MHTKGNWSISGEDTSGKLWTTADGKTKTIYFGHKTSVKALHNCGERVNLSKMPHSMGQPEDEAVNCFIAAADAIKNAFERQNTVRVHCAHGRSRTAFTLMVYLTRHGGLGWDDARELVVAGQRERTDTYNFQVVPKTLAKSANGRPQRAANGGGGIDQGYDGWIRERMALVTKSQDQEAFAVHANRDKEGVMRIVGTRAGKRGPETDAAENLPEELRRPAKRSNRRTPDEIARADALNFLGGAVLPTRLRSEDR